MAKYYIDRGQGMKPLKKYLQKQGWFETDLLPPGWYLRQKFTANNFWFLTNKGVKFNNTTKVIEHLREEYKWKESLISKFLNGYKSLITHKVDVKRKRVKEETLTELPHVENAK